MQEILTATAKDKEDVIDFANYVFSQSRVPHDFKTLIPVAYADEVEGLGAEHYLIKKDGKIRATAAKRSAPALSARSPFIPMPEARGI